jgi:ABC-type sugar transport system substrate-binding protein
MKKLRFLVSLQTLDNDYQEAQAQAGQDTTRTLGGEAEIVYAENDAVNQSMQLLTAIQRSASINLVAAQDDSMAMGGSQSISGDYQRSGTVAMAELTIHRM